MATESAVVDDAKEDAAGLSTQEASNFGGGGKQPITPAERWVLICENVYARAQKREFVGGNALQDLVAAEQEIDAAHETDVNCVFSLTGTYEITEQLKCLFAGYGFGQEDIEHLLDGHQDALEKLAAMNRDAPDKTSGPAVEQAELLQRVASEAVIALQSFAEGRLRSEGVFKTAELSMQAFANAVMGSQSSNMPRRRAK